MHYSIFVDGLWLDEDTEEMAETMELDYNGVTMEIKVTDINAGEIVRVISSNPNDYLNTQYQPGTKIEFHPTFG
ncbi:YlzJ-like protein [Orenia metallireducens]|uniref:YlzJ-like protein n=1 Tax=Orenia metallireducens TaxID=1413210 RepID=A0A285FML9_9FIRM|nr:YlzJ-like family protein [Orenia metallireducens]PRX33590.1 YlzJ-like protein [Orenia metallireducens]SNY11481.1 YlzJ-like protein [Orenia metallireducens]